MRQECRSCAFFEGDPAGIERALAGLTSLGSGYGSTRADDGLCGLHQRFRSARFCCSDFQARPES